MIKFLTLCFLILAIFLGPPTARGDISFDLRSATKASYMSFISQLRSALPTKEKVYNIPVLPSTASGSQWFTFIKLTNYADETITVAINVTNVYIVAYRTNDVSYFFDETPTEAFKLLFKGTQQITLSYSGNYDRLQTAAGKIRENIELGLPALSSAITNLVYYDYKSTAVALLVLIQSTAEAARYKHIEQQVARHVNSNFMPSQAIISLENNWAALSKQIQIAQYRSGQFENPVELINPSGERFQVTNVSFNVVKSNIALLLYYKVSAANDNNTPTMLPITTTISGRDETTVRMMPNNYGYKMERKWIGNGRDNYVTMKV